MISRRIFLKNGGLTLVGMGVVPNFLLRSAIAVRSGSASEKILVTVFLRGGADGLNVVIPYGEKEYFKKRPNIAIPAPSKNRPSAIELNDFFGLHPALESLVPIFREGQMAIVHAVGSPHSTRSHFDAQDFIESGVPGDKSVDDGFLNRFLQQSGSSEASPFRGIAMGTVLPRALKGDATAIALGSLNRFDLMAGRRSEEARSVYETLYHEESDSLLAGTAKEMFDAIDKLKEANPGRYRPRAGVSYPGNQLGRKLQQVAQMIKADLGVEAAFVDAGGWDHHVNEGGLNGQLSNLLRQLGASLSAFYRDLGDKMEDVVVLTVSEFGRTVHENGNGGTDHGHANVMFALGGPVKGGKIYGRWPGLAPDRLFEGRDLEVTTDFRQVFAEFLVHHKNCNNIDSVFPGFASDRSQFLGLI